MPNAEGTDGPFASIARAQFAVRERLAAHSGRSLTVVLRQGTYYLALSPTNPGTLRLAFPPIPERPNAPVTWATIRVKLPSSAEANRWEGRSRPDMAQPFRQSLAGPTACRHKAVRVSVYNGGAVCAREVNPIPPPASAIICVMLRVIPPTEKKRSRDDDIAPGNLSPMADTVAPTVRNMPAPARWTSREAVAKVS